MNRRTLRRKAHVFCSLRSPRRLAELLKTRLHRLQLMALRPEYYHFTIPKPDGSERFLEDPEPHLKRVQRTLNRYLQAVYFFVRTGAAYGFMPAVKGDPTPRNILTNARHHLGETHFLNADMEDFFHTVRQDRVAQIFAAEPFDFSAKMAELLAGLCCYQGRLPMGAPSSPVLSNHACRGLDAKLARIARENGLKFTRFADDMTFSGDAPIDESLFQAIGEAVAAEGFRLNPDKIRFFGPDDTPEVTGLRLLKDRVALPAGFIDELDGHVDRLKNVLEVAHYQGRRPPFARKYQQQVEGMLAFASFVMGDTHPEVERVDARLDLALHPDAARFGALRWWELTYG